MALLALASALLVGCIGADYQAYVVNHSGQGWLIRGGTFGAVVVVPSESEALAVAWKGDPSARIEVLDDACSVVGIFTQDADGNLVITEIDGLTGIVQPYRWNDPWNTGAFARTTQCGGRITVD